MPIHVAINHITTYTYDRRINLGSQIIRLRPAPHSRTPVLSYSLKITPHNHFINWQQDPQGNYLARVVFPDKTDIFRVEVDLTADMTIINPFDFFLEEYAKDYPFRYELWLEKELKPFLEKKRHQEVFNNYLRTIETKKQVTIDFLVGLNQRLHNDIKYLIRLEHGVQTPEETLEKSSGSCRDSAWLLVNLLRHKGLAARFVSGYLIQLKADVKSLDGPSGAEKDFTDLHAWTEVYLPGAGWIGLDPTSGLLTGEGHVPLVATPEPASASPITGLLDKCKVDFNHEMVVTRIHEDPRVTKPFTDEQWDSIHSIGLQVDRGLEKEDVRLTMGGEPTFVSIDDMEGGEWNTEALGKNKRCLSEILFKRLKNRWTHGALIYSGQGKWYPGEQLPRWVLGCCWRKDGKAIWKDERLIADETKEYSFSTEHANQFIKTLAVHIGVDPSCIIPGYEDVWYYIWKEKRLPKNVDPLKSKLKDVLERNRLAKIFDKELGEIVGFALPLTSKESEKTTNWISGRWQFRDQYMYLIPGDSPMGLRMPLDSLPWISPEDIPQVYERDPLAQVEDFIDIDNHTSGRTQELKKQWQKKTPRKEESDEEVVRTALCVQARNGIIYLFVPPLSTIENYLDLIDKVEKTAKELSIPVIIEGYAPPYDSRIDSFKITPDPGVIEVNVAPTSNWKELVQQTTSLYQEAHFSRLGTEKFMLDGRHSGTGGGNHVVLGGHTPADSPFLRRPDLLASLVSYWHNHPSLSYLFSGLFVGPTSQAPRVDEGRRDSVYELEIAIQQVKSEISKSGQCLPWIVDRLFRHILVDGTGNTHRAEFCIDKLFSPDSSTGRLGLVEFRSFEMPPHAQMSIVQQLLIRALILKFWNNDYSTKLVRWNTTLHDRFLLPHFVREDFQDVLCDLNEVGIELEMDYFDPHFEFRFPVIGRVNYKGIELELRTAIEPWYVLGEEPAGGGTTRFVDSSVERLQVKVKGATDKRYKVCCNRRALPLHPTGPQGEYVAGIRYRAWQPPSCLHPTVPAHAPLTFDIVDTWSMRSIGGCVYHVAHPGGRNYETFPVNAYEADARRAARFFKIGHTPGTLMSLPQAEQNPDFPFTLDLRRA
ncbi:MAG: transglutaminase family protein [Candidatus Scalindua sp. AMX11]|nr:MAG: IMP dehydrogenase [Candidatus Scalindua sp.]NOG85898.1 transglutaminase family protein [Planctomycetota bacterium]RZV96931.1 MAG: transglutaminase family protein [Candidatus Scalindua sp. SCAELEC01]TDE66456.1 MAG: transglutaminase family protein [Candidatus Scalindua sp. AMX11]GJQ60209.1 MAG: IMP dehydrogenase [Candidatus Scalindua sp.]